MRVVKNASLLLGASFTMQPAFEGHTDIEHILDLSFAGVYVYRVLAPITGIR